MSSRTRLVLIGSIVLVTIVLTAVFVTRFGTDPRLSPSPLIGQVAPDVAVDLVESADSLAMSDLRGDIVIVNFWAPWCVPCRAEHADLLALVEQYGPFGVTVLGITYQSDEAAVIDYLDELGRGYPVGMDDRSRAAIEFGVRGVPETYFIDREGVVVGKVNGAITYELASATLDRIILGADPNDPPDGG